MRSRRIVKICKDYRQFGFVSANEVGITRGFKICIAKSKKTI